MDLSIIIVNWNSAHFLASCLDSIYKHVTGITFEVIVVDNASYDGSEKIVTEQFPRATFIQSDENLGFPKANNLGYKHSNGRSLLFLNPDTKLLDDRLPAMLQYLDSSENVGAVGCEMVNEDLTLQTRYVQAFPTVLNQLLAADILVRMFPKSRMWGVHPAVEFRGRPLDVEVLAGSFILAKRAVFELAGRFNEAFFIYAEDVDLCYMIKQSGYKIQYIGFPSLVHYGAQSSASAGESHFSAIMQRESIALFLKMRRGAIYSATYRVMTAIVACLRISVLWCLYPVAKLRRTGAQLLSSRRKWTKLLRWSFGLERWVASVGRCDTAPVSKI
jgi:GT2 family glycosyltransferase